MNPEPEKSIKKPEQNTYTHTQIKPQKFEHVLTHKQRFQKITGEAIEKKANGFAVRRSNKVSVAKQRRVAFVETDGSDVE